MGAVAGAILVYIPIPDNISKPEITAAFLRQLIPRLDLFGFALFAPAAIMFLMALQFGSSDYEWDSQEVIGLFCGGGVLFLVFLLWEYRKGEDAMIPLSLVRQKIVWTSCVSFGFLMVGTMVGSNFLHIYFQTVKGVSPTMSGVYSLASILSQILFILISGALGKSRQLSCLLRNH